MRGRLVRWWADPDGRRDENSNSFIMLVVLLPVLLGAFGLGVDMSRNLYVRTSIQANLDLATYSGATVAIRKSGDANTTVVDPVQSLREVERVYAVNRATGPGMRCIGSRAKVVGTEHVKCWKQPKKATASNRTVTYSVEEQTVNAFLQVLGVPLQTYRIDSKAVINAATR